MKTLLPLGFVALLSITLPAQWVNVLDDPNAYTKPWGDTAT